MFQAITTIAALATNPAVQLGGAALFALAAILAAYAIRTQPKAADVAQDLADISEEIEPWVIEAENRFLLPREKYRAVLDQAQAWLKEQGITGRRGRFIQKHLPALIELTVKKVDPKPQAPAKAA